MTFNPADYHPDWQWIRRQILDQADHRCEWCGVANHAVGARDQFGEWHAEDDIDHLNSDTGYALFGDEGYPKIIRIVLTTAHVCQDKTCIDPTHLAALCQRCHLNHDREHHREKARETHRRKVLASTGQLELLEATS